MNIKLKGKRVSKGLLQSDMAKILNIGIYNSGILNGETFNMFYISPYFISILPIYSNVQEILPYGLYLMFYIITIFLGAHVIFLISFGIKNKIKF